MCYPDLVETFYLFEDLTCFLLVSPRFNNVFPVSQILIISEPAADHLQEPIPAERGVSQGWPHKAAPRLSQPWVEAVAHPVTPPALPTDRSQCSISVNRLICGHCRPNWPLGKDSGSVLCLRGSTMILPPWQCLSQNPTLLESACWLSQEDAAYRDNKNTP